MLNSYLFSKYSSIAFEALQIGHSAVTWLIQTLHNHFPLEATGLNELSERLEIKYSQQAAWKEYTKLIGMLVEPPVNESCDDAETNLHSRAEMANDFSKALVRISDATSKLKTVLTEDEQKILHLLNFEWVMLHFRHQIRP